MKHPPHKPPVLFAVEPLKHEPLAVTVRLNFTFTPTLPMLIEAAAQSFAWLDADFIDEANGGMLVQAKNVRLSNTPQGYDNITVKIIHEARFGAMHQLGFFVTQGAAEIAQGTLQIALQS